MNLKLQIFIPLFCISIFVKGQTTIEIRNPSLESVPRSGTMYGFAPTSWKDCSHHNQTSIDIQPGQFETTIAPNDGNSYVGMVTRESQTWEGISQRLTSPILKDKKYEITIYLARSNNYKSRTQGSNKLESFANPTP